VVLALGGAVTVAAVQASAGGAIEKKNVELLASNANYLRMADVRRLAELNERGKALLKNYQPPRADLEKWVADSKILGARVGEHRARLGELNASIAAGSAESDVLWQRDVISDLVAGLDELSNPANPASAASRIALKLDLWKRTGIETPLWKAAIDSISDARECPAYNGLVIQPQFGLLPIGRDPQSGLWEFVNVDTGVAPMRDAEGKIIISADMGVVLVLLPGGKFWMGSQNEDLALPNYYKGASSMEGPVHEVELDPFFISKYEMTQTQWLRLTGKNPSQWINSTDSELFPVEFMTWDDCAECLPNAGLLLPTEAQWEYACRAGTETPWWIGDDEMLVLLGGNIQFPISSEDSSGRVRVRRVGLGHSNAFGLHDTIGNVSEWCRDSDSEDYWNPPAAGDGLRSRGIHDLGSIIRMARGGGWGNSTAHARSAARSYCTPGIRLHSLGVRPARVITQ
jgi:formylglycine-generating enzyme required for sulfatase activity